MKILAVLCFASATLMADGKIPSHPRVREAERLVSEGRAAVSLGNSAEARDFFDKAIDYLLDTPANDPSREALDRYIQNLAEQIYAIDLESLGAARSLDEVRFDKSPLDEIRELTFPVDPRLKSKVQQELQATSSQLPLVMNETVLGFINYFANGKGRKTLEYALKRSGKYRPMIFRVLAEEGVPPELIYLAQAESGFLPRAVSYKAAVGMWQFIKETGKTYGLTQSPWTDDRLDPERATRAAAKHLRDLYGDLGDWHLALAAYNCGQGCVDRAVQKTAFADYWELRNRHAVPIETTNYVPIILALTIIMKNPADYGLADLEMESPLEYDTVEVYSNTSLQLVADAAQVPITSVQDLNPAILHNLAPSGYFLRLPKGSTDAVSSAFKLVPPDKRDTWRLHKVQDGESPEWIARQYHVTTAAFEQANPDFVNAGFAAVPQMTPKPKPAKITPTRITPTRISKSTIRPTATKKSGTRPTAAKPATTGKPARKTTAAKH